MDRQSAIAIITFLNRALACNVPTTGAEWDAIRRGLAEIEKIANGLVMQEPKPDDPL